MARSTGEQKNDTYKLYGQAVKLLHDQKYDKAREVLTRCEEQFSDEIEVLARVRTYLKVCAQRQREDESKPKETEDLYLRGVIEHNNGNYDEALKIYKNALKKTDTDGDYIYLAMAAAESRAGKLDEALKHLKQSIEIDSDNRFAALYDPDFEPLRRNEQFQQLLREARKG